jgi:hypothetical protein
MMHWTISCTLCGISAGTYNPLKEPPPVHVHSYVHGRPVSVYICYERALVAR